MSFREEIAKQLKFDATHPNLNESYISQADKILKLFEKRIDELLETDYSNSQTPVYEDGFEDALEKVKEMLK